ncbi:hypothetical protein EXIGLDRAFT_644426 [Exidia glandulosa HHB12029]|uniref:ribonuclease H n=1 Tax=Exidia glandulosa HHB12029 TaxID=1314781 RepID=A0A165JRZ2_EXIGL|nr:hypothetical protein EXIGLDRAFT_644426 [Exidia glandulosa HHB12029]
MSDATVLVEAFRYCATHGLDLCRRCPCDHRFSNNLELEKYVAEYTDKDLAIAALRLVTLYRTPLNLNVYGVPTNRVAINEDDGRIWMCRNHCKDSCTECFDFIRTVLEAFGVYEAIDPNANADDIDRHRGKDIDYETASDDSDGPPPLIDVDADLEQPRATAAKRISPSGSASRAERVVHIQPVHPRPGPPHETLPGNPLYRVNYAPIAVDRRPKSLRTTSEALIKSMTRPDCPRRFVPPTPSTRPQDLFRERYDLSGDPYRRYLHRGDDYTMLVYTDGACLDQGGPSRRGGCGVVFCDSTLGLKHALEGTIGGPEQTSNRAELRAVLYFLQLRRWEAGGAERIVIATDSEYVVDGVCVNLATWVQRGWRTKKGKPVANRDLWEALLNELRRNENGDLRILFWWIPRELNTRAAALAKGAADKSDRSAQPGWYLVYRCNSQHIDCRKVVAHGKLTSLRLLNSNTPVRQSKQVQSHRRRGGQSDLERHIPLRSLEFTRTGTDPHCSRTGQAYSRRG